MLLLGQAEGVFAALVVRCSVLSHHSLVLKGFTLPNAAAPQGEHLCQTNAGLSDKGTARCSRCGNKTPHCGSLVPRIESPTRITPAALGFQGAILRRRGESGKLFGRPPAVRSGRPFGGPEGVLCCGRKRESIPDRTHVLVFAWTDVRTCSHMSGCTNTNILARPLAGKSESEHPHTHDYQHPFTNSCKRSCLHASAHRVIISFKHRFIVEHIPVRVSVCSQKGGVGKSSLTVLVASWLHYVMKRNVLVVDCDFPQWSIYTQRECELHVSKFTNRPQEYGWRDRNPPLLTTFQADFIKPYDYGICKGKIEVVGEPVRTRNHLLSTHASSAGETAPDID